MNKQRKEVRTGRKGFTLVELLAVVIILAILAYAGSGTYKKAVEQSRFSDGLVQATSVMEAVERYHAEHLRASDSTLPTKAKLDISLTNQKACASPSNYCYKTKYFETTIYNGWVDSVRKKNGQQGDYTVRVYSSSFGSNMRKGAVCIYHTTPGQDLCVGLGYVSCDENSICSKQ